MNLLSLHFLLVNGDVAVGNNPHRKAIVPSAVFGMVVFIITEVMFFSGLISAYLIIRAGLEEWPPWGQPRLPIEATAFNTFLLILSAFAVFKSQKFSQQQNKPKAFQFHFAAIILGVCFLILQGYEWFQLLQFGMTLSSSVYGALFYLIIGAHGIHILAALMAMVYAINFFQKTEFENQISEKMLPIQILWYFVVGIWPFLYIIVYLI